MRDALTARRLAAPALGLTIVLSSSAALAQVPSTAPAPAPAPAQAPATMDMATTTRATSLAEAISIALRQSPDVLTQQAAVSAAEAQRAQVSGQFGPKLHVDANAQQWNSPFDLSFNLGVPLPPGASVPALRVRDAFTWLVSPEIIQPITPLFAIYDQYKMQDYGVDVATIKREVARREVAFQVVQGYYRLLEAERLSEVAEASVTQLQAQQKEAQSLFDNGVIGKNDLLRAQLALASARQRAIQMRGQVVLVRSALDTTMGLPPDSPLEPVPFTGEPPGFGEETIQSAESRAVAQRPEIREVDKTIDQASSAVALAKQKFLPQINAIGNYTHQVGQQFLQEDAAYVGLFASWDVWDWGTTLNGVHEAHAKLDEARIARKKLEDQVRLEARQAYVNAQTARDALDVARTAVAQAEENYRIVTKKFEANAATAFDVVDAESLLTEARGQVQTALYNLLIARAALQRATGERLDGE